MSIQQEEIVQTSHAEITSILNEKSTNIPFIIDFLPGFCQYRSVHVHLQWCFVPSYPAEIIFFHNLYNHCHDNCKRIVYL